MYSEYLRNVIKIHPRNGSQGPLTLSLSYFFIYLINIILKPNIFLPLVFIHLLGFLQLASYWLDP